MTLEDELVSAKRKAQTDVNQLLELELQQSRGLGTAKLETIVFSNEKDIGIAILVDREVENQDLPLLQAYAIKFVEYFLGYLSIKILQASKKVNVLASGKGDEAQRLLFTDEYYINQLAAGHFQIRGDNLNFSIRYTEGRAARQRPHVTAGTDNTSTIGYSSVYAQQDLTRQGLIKSAIGAVIDLYRAIKFYHS